MVDEHAAKKNDEGISLSAPVIMELIEAVHEKGASFRFQARGFSMTPSIRDGDVITVSPFGGSKLRCGDVVAFRHPERSQMLVHRVLHSRGNEVFVRGDSCPEADGWVPLENVIGIVTRVERHGRPRFWLNRSKPSLGVYVYLFFYPFWPPARRIMARFWRRLRKLIHPEK